MYSGNNIIGDLKNDEIRFFAIYDGVWGWSNVYHGTFIVANFFIASLCARNCILGIKLLAISRTTKLDFFRIFEANKGNLRRSAVLASLPIFL